MLTRQRESTKKIGKENRIKLILRRYFLFILGKNFKIDDYQIMMSLYQLFTECLVKCNPLFTSVKEGMERVSYRKFFVYVFVYTSKNMYTNRAPTNKIFFLQIGPIQIKYFYKKKYF